AWPGQVLAEGATCFGETASLQSVHGAAVADEQCGHLAHSVAPWAARLGAPAAPRKAGNDGAGPGWADPPFACKSIVGLRDCGMATGWGMAAWARRARPPRQPPVAACHRSSRAPGGKSTASDVEGWPCLLPL